jgi:hypothetical protein
MAPAAEFLDFMNELVAKNSDKEIHVVLENLNTHKPKQDRWLKAHPQTPRCSIAAARWRSVAVGQ